MMKKGRLKKEEKKKEETVAAPITHQNADPGKGGIKDKSGKCAC